eukprot:365906-Chlamydomonas_euryale.AAC.18
MPRKLYTFYITYSHHSLTAPHSFLKLACNSCPVAPCYRPATNTTNNTKHHHELAKSEYIRSGAHDRCRVAMPAAMLPGGPLNIYRVPMQAATSLSCRWSQTDFYASCCARPQAKGLSGPLATHLVAQHAAAAPPDDACSRPVSEDRPAAVAAAAATAAHAQNSSAAAKVAHGKAGRQLGGQAGRRTDSLFTPSCAAVPGYKHVRTSSTVAWMEMRPTDMCMPRSGWPQENLH